jgi:curved DNA-binding protein CbpA
MGGDDVYSLKDNKALYNVLGLDRSATADQIKKSFRQLSLKHHPDRGGDAEVFKQLAFAYNVLSDPEQRGKYDSQTLKKHIASEARQRDPGMDPDVELEGEELRSFVERLHNEQMDRVRQRAEFERKRDEEYRRRAEFDAANPSFRMPESPAAAYSGSGSNKSGNSSSAPSPATMSGGYMSSTASSPFLAEALRGYQSSGAAGVGRTSADMLAALRRNQQQENEAPDASSASSASPAGSPSSSFRSSDSSAKRAMMDRFRVEREASGVAPCVVDATTKSTLQSAAASHKYGFVKDASKDAYEYEVEKVRARQNFNYRGFVERGYHDGSGVVKEAILADALDKYDNSKPSAGLD